MQNWGNDKARIVEKPLGVSERLWMGNGRGLWNVNAFSHPVLEMCLL
jgi:hypothetical protein